MRALTTLEADAITNRMNIQTFSSISFSRLFVEVERIKVQAPSMMMKSASAFAWRMAFAFWYSSLR
jgi:hypothetical protein